MADLKAEFQYYQTHKDEFHQKHEGKFIVIKDQKVIGVYENMLSAINETKKAHELGSFLVQHVNKSDEQVRFHSRYSSAQ